MRLDIVLVLNEDIVAILMVDRPHRRQFLSLSVTSSTTGPQSLKARCRKIDISSYQCGSLSGPSTPHCQQDDQRSRSQVSLPMLAARWGISVSTVMIRSQVSINRAVSQRS